MGYWKHWVIFFVLVIVLVLQSGCTTTETVEVTEEQPVEEVKKTTKRMTNPVLCAILFLSVDCSVKEKDNVKLEPEVHAVPEEDPILELLIDLGEVEPNESK